MDAPNVLQRENCRKYHVKKILTIRLRLNMFWKMKHGYEDKYLRRKSVVSCLLDSLKLLASGGCDTRPLSRTSKI